MFARAGDGLRRWNSFEGRRESQHWHPVRVQDSHLQIQSSSTAIAATTFFLMILTMQ